MLNARSVVSHDFHFVRNPHVPGQMLKAAVPKGKGAGDKFDVKVPAPVVSEAGDKNNLPNTTSGVMPKVSTFTVSSAV